MSSRVQSAIEVAGLLVVPATLVACTLLDLEQTALLTLLAAVAAIAIFSTGYELSAPRLRQIMPTVVLAALAAAGRILFVAIPDFKPVTAICILAGCVFGRRSGFMVGALAALSSNFFFGHGPWTPWQMYSWGLVGYLAGVLESRGAFRARPTIYVYGFLAPVIYTLVMNGWYCIGYVRPFTLAGIAAAFAASLPFDLIHCAATLVFLLVLYAPWRRKLERIRTKYALELD